MTYSKAFEKALDHAMKFEVGGFWNAAHPAVARGLVDTLQNRRAVGYVNDPVDRGGETKFGVAKRANVDLDIKTLTWEGAKAVYYKRYWLAGKCDKLPPRLAVLHFDGCVNHGVERANRFLQAALNVETDGVVGPVTLAKVRTMDEQTLLVHICGQRTEFYHSIVRRSPAQARFLAGWLNRINDVRKLVTTGTFN